jgi:hypothetical protein
MMCVVSYTVSGYLEVMSGDFPPIAEMPDSDGGELQCLG